MIKKLKTYHVELNSWTTSYFFVVDRYKSEVFETEYAAIQAMLEYTIMI